MAVIEVALGARGYEVVVQSDWRGLATRLGTPRHAVLVSDTTVAPLWAEALRAALPDWTLVSLLLPAGESYKTLETWQRCVDGLLAAGVTRESLVLALGGGVVGDLAGFAAACTLRGLPVVQLPTTLLAMVDASVGGKTAVNHARGKNLIGVFYQPSLVMAALDTLGTLPTAELRSGLGEVLKTALILDAELLELLERDAEELAEGEPRALAPVVARCVALKAEVVVADEREGGLRAILNAGHTVGHGVEAAAGYGRLRHGEAVGLGLLAELRWAVRHGHCVDLSLPARVQRLLGRLGLPTRCPELSQGAMEAAMTLDKKARGDTLLLPVVVRAGESSLISISRDAVGDLVSELP